jgi:glycosyltransferase involved in cell wall biosynthesis
MPKKNKKKSNSDRLPKVSICTITFNRRPFISNLIKIIENQTYPLEKVEWIIIDDGTDKIGDLVSNIPYAKYFSYDEKLTIGKKRNLSHEKSTGDIIVYMDDDDYYPPERIEHAVTKLSKTNNLIVGSSEMYIYFNELNEMYRFGPYGENHSTAATFAFKRELLKITKYEEDASLSEEKFFLKDYTIPLTQLDTMKTILVFSHSQNTFDKKELLKQKSPYVNKSSVKLNAFIKNSEIMDFYKNRMNHLLDEYKDGNVVNKPDVVKELARRKEERESSSKNKLTGIVLNDKELTVQNVFDIINGLKDEIKQLKENRLSGITFTNKEGKDVELTSQQALQLINNGKEETKRLDSEYKDLLLKYNNLKEDYDNLLKQNHS